MTSPTQELILVWQVTHEGSTYTTESLPDVVLELTEAEECGNSEFEYLIRRKRMLKSEFEGLPEFTGF